MFESSYSCHRDSVFLADTDALDEAVLGTAVSTPHPDGCDVSLNLDAWNVGDILLSGPNDKDVGTEAITRYQKALNPDLEVHRWWHVAIYDGNFGVLEALPDRNVVRSNILDWCLNYPVFHRMRLRDVLVDLDAFNAVAMRLSNQPYQIQGHISRLLVSRFARSKLSLPSLKSPYSGENLICSVFVERFIRELSNSEIFRHLEIVLPMDFVQCEALQSQKSCWVKSVVG